MKILKSKFSIFLISTMVGYTALGVDSSYAGFRENYSMPLQNAETQTQFAKSEKQVGLQIFEDRYVPESIQKKYNLNDNWFDAQQPPVNVIPNVLPSDALEIRSSKPIEQEIVTGTWRASKGENLRDVLQRWSERSKIDLMWAAPESPVLKDGFSFVGKYQDAVNRLIKKEGGDIHSQYRSEGLNPVMMSPASTITTNTPPEAEVDKSELKNLPYQSLSRVFKPADTQNEKPETRWFGLSGAPLAEVIKVWAEDAGVTLIWQSEKNFALQDTISHIGHFEDAVFKALSQYDNDSIRPVGEIYNDPKTGQVVLLVKTEVN